MNVRTVGVLLTGTIVFVPSARAQQQDFSKVQIKVTKVSGNIYMLEGAGGNIAASVGEDGIVRRISLLRLSTTR